MPTVTEFAELLKGLATLAWPGIIILLILKFRPAIESLIESATSREFTIEVGGQKLTMKEANLQQRSLITDLQAQVFEIRQKVDGPSQSSTKALPAPPCKDSVLWVDDEPKNNSYLIQSLTDMGVDVDIALSTSEGLKLFGRKTYGVIISDMGRTEDGVFKGTAGMEFLKTIRESNKTIPFIIYCSIKKAKAYKDDSIKLGATAITSSPAEMFGILQTVLMEP